MKKKIIRITTVPGSMRSLLKGQLNFMSNYYEIIGVSGGGHELEKVGKQEGIRTVGIEMTRSITPLKDLVALYHLYRVFKREKPHIVHSHTPKAGTLGMIASKLARVPNRIHTIAGLPLLEAKGTKRMLLNFVERLTYRSATLILPNSFALQKIVINEKFCSENKLKVIGNGSSNGIDTNHFKRTEVTNDVANNLRKQLGIDPEHIVFLFVGRVVKDKGINELVEAFVAINKIFAKTVLIIAGPRETALDPIKPETTHLIQNHPNIHETGWVQDVRPYIFISDVLAFPSYREGFPNVVLQASCMELPCIVTDINGCNEIIIHNYNGLVIPPKNVIELQKAMLEMIENPKKRKELATNARPNILDKYKRELIWRELLAVYQNLD